MIPADRELTPYFRNQIVREYLDSLKGGDDERRRVSLKGIEGVTQGHSSDPKEIERAIPIVEARLPSIDDPLDRLKALKRIRTMRETLANLREEGPKARFVKIAKEWCADHGYDYAIMRDAGVPASVLKEAGIE